MTSTVLAYIPSPSQGVWYLGPLPIRAYALFIIIGIVAALVIGDRRWEARGGERGVIYDLALWAVPFGLIGGRLYHVITDWPKYFGDGGAGLVGALRIWDGGLGIWGAVALGGVGAWIGCKRRGIPLPAFGDAIAPGIVLAQAIGRLGNYFNQELYGRPTTLPWGLEIYERQNSAGVVSPDLANGVSTGQLYSVVHPTFLYELLWNVLVFAVLIWVDRRFRVGHGRLFALYVAGYCVGRFWIELLRSDEATMFADIRINSFTSTFVFVGAVVYIMLAPKGREDPAALAGKPRESEKLTVDGMAEELAAVAATTGVVAAAKVAGEDEDEDARAAEGEAEADESEVALAAEELGADMAGVPSDSVADAEEFAAEGEADDEEEEEEEAEPQSEAAADAEALAADVAEAPSEEIAEAEEAAPESHEGAVEGAEEAEEVAADQEEAEDAETEEPESEDAEAEEPEAEEVAADQEEAEDAEEAAKEEAAKEEASTEDADAEPTAESVGGVGAVGGEEAVEAEEAAREAHDAAVEGAEEAEEVAADVAADQEEAVAAEAEEATADESEPGEPAAEVFEPKEPETEEPETQEPETQEPETDEPETEESEPEGSTAEPVKPEAIPADEPAEESGGRIRRWLRGRRNG